MIAVLVLAHGAPSVLGFSARKYQEAGFKVLVHVDKKIDIDRYRQEMGPSAEGCNFISDRKNIHWGGFSMIEATMELMSEALSDGQIKRLALVSDDSIPCRPISELAIQLSMDVERIGMRKLGAQDYFFERYRGFFFFDHIATAPRWRPMHVSQVDHELISNMLAISSLMARGKKVIDVFHGSQWWCLTRDCAELVLGVHRTDAQIRESFKFSGVPDESYIQSIIGNYAADRMIAHSPMLVDWSREPWPFVFSSVEDIKARVQDHHAFVRKVRFGMEGVIDLTGQARST
jgi:hypothetical protein